MVDDAAIDVLFVMPPGGIVSGHVEHLGIAFLRAMLHRAGLRSRQYLPEWNVSPSAFARDLLEVRPRLVGFTVYESNRNSCRALAAVVRSCLPGCVILAGGPSATFSPEETLEFLGADACLRGAGEGTIVAIAEAILGHDGASQGVPELLDPVPNLVLRSADGVRRTRTGDVSSFPADHFECLDDIPSPYQEGLVSTPEVGYLTARGCNQHCTYCSFAAISGRRVHHHGVDRVLEDLAALRRIAAAAPRWPRSVPIGDDAFTLAPRRAEAICERIIARGLQMPFDCETRADRVDAALLRLMRRAGFVGVAFGLESAVPHVLRAAGKVQDPATSDDPGFERERAYLDSVVTAVRDARSAGLAPSVSVIGGLPGEQPDDLRATLEFVRTLEVPVYAHNVLMVLPGTPLHQERRRHGLNVSRHPVTGSWRTRHAYDVDAIVPLGNSTVQIERWAEAERICDALCGRPRPLDASDDAAWAAVLHGDDPDLRTLRWLAGILAIPSTLVVVASRELGDDALDAWEIGIARSGIVVSHLALLSPEELPEGRRFTTRGTSGVHWFDLLERWDPGLGGPVSDPTGSCRIPLWIASGAEQPPFAPADSDLVTPTPQIADGCRWWNGGRRCGQPRVLHLAEDGEVRACWSGPPIGRVGDRFADLRERGRALGRSSGVLVREGRGAPCPMGRAGEGRSTAGDLEIASQLSWMARRVLA